MRSVVFDLDGTLITFPDDPDWFTDAVTEQLGVDPAEAAWEHYRDRTYHHFEQFDGDPYRAAAAETAAEYDLGVDAETFAAACNDAEVYHSTVPDAVRDLLDALDGVETTVLTNGYSPLQHRKLAHHGLDGYFSTVHCSDDLEAIKPDPAAFEGAHAAVPDERPIYVGDSRRSDLPAHQHGFDVVLVDDDPADAALATVPTAADLGQVRDLIVDGRGA